MLDYAVAFVNFAGAFPTTTAINASGPATQDGTEFTANMINDSLWGVNQMILNRAGLTPNGVLESDTASQIKDALLKGFGGAPGMVQQWGLAAAATTGYRCLFLNGQGVLRASYTELDVAVYVGDANNAAVAAAGGAFYHADDAAGTIPNIAGVWLILPETRGYVPRGLDVAASVDPLGAARYLGDNQVDAMQGHYHNVRESGAAQMYFAATAAAGAGGVSTTTAGATTIQAHELITDGVNGVPRISSETRMVNFSTKFVIWY